ncbi:methyltransferase domain-containing protein [Lentilactobacillus sunkii]|uniref:Type 11 methyltransferase n=1 Tax=Lentilactobacillus sunkii DSM 19904 TaxID=1423808 RepID=A0A0R1L932_9LACO|nr:methyltransferase domain-containing protein [Lentilactobacillus sunkii]KRK88970.1 type 11 methyltransferase [Lentilactobacillus sunkii DSM 19904]
MKKIDFGREFVNQHLNLFRCPVCKLPFDEVTGYSLVCPNNHSFDLSKKGTLFFLTKQANNEYDKSMLQARHNILQAGLFDPIVNEIAKHLSDQPEIILDVGCGEGTPLARLLKLRNQRDTAIGFDISKDGINLATQQPVDAFFCVADLARLPFNNHSFSTIIDLFSPSAYDEFNRVAQSGGKLIKIIPNSHYLFELREALFGKGQKNSSYSNEKVFDLFMTHYPDASIHELTYPFLIPEGMQQDMMIMTPLHWGKDRQADAIQKVDGMKSITVDVSVMVADF